MAAAVVAHATGDFPELEAERKAAHDEMSARAKGFGLRGDPLHRSAAMQTMQATLQGAATHAETRKGVAVTFEPEDRVVDESDELARAVTLLNAHFQSPTDIHAGLRSVTAGQQPGSGAVYRR